MNGAVRDFYNTRKPLLLLISLSFGVASVHAKAQDDPKGWNVVNDKSATTAKGDADALETAAPPALDIEAAKQRQALAPLEEPQPVLEEPQPEGEASQPDVKKPQLAGEAQDLQPSNKAIVATPIPTTPIIDLSPALRDGLERQFKQMRKLLETEDAFSESLGEIYLSYGTLLQQAGRLDESRKMLVNALHISKVNNGVNSIEQRPVLRALFELNYARENTEELEDNLRRIIWLEKKVPEMNDDYSFDMVVRMGNHFLDQYLQNPTISEYNLSNLNKAARYFRLAVNRYGDRPLNELFMPYGELAYAHFLKSRIQNEVDRSFYQDTRQRTYTELDKLYKPRKSLGGSFSTSERYLREYLQKANNEGEQEHIVEALLNLGDLNILFGRRVGATSYYEQAWEASQTLPLTHPIVASFDNPQLLPAFNFARARPQTRASGETFGSSDQFLFVPLTFDIDIDGNVKRIEKDAIDGTTGWNLSRAKRLARKMKFRPIIDNGKLVKSLKHQHDIKVRGRADTTTAKSSS